MKVYVSTAKLPPLVFGAVHRSVPFDSPPPPLFFLVSEATRPKSNIFDGKLSTDVIQVPLHSYFDNEYHAFHNIELQCVHRTLGVDCPLFSSFYILSPKGADCLLILSFTASAPCSCLAVGNHLNRSVPPPHLGVFSHHPIHPWFLYHLYVPT